MERYDYRESLSPRYETPSEFRARMHGRRQREEQKNSEYKKLRIKND